VVISIVDQVKTNPNYALQVADIKAWEEKRGRIPEGSVVSVRSDWSKAWPDPKLATLKEFPGVGLDALKFLHEERHILFHGHEPLDTDSTPNLEGEVWLMHHGYAQAEGVANLDKVPETGALVGRHARAVRFGCSNCFRGCVRRVKLGRFSQGRYGAPAVDRSR
jgi:kynurenine formamidase